MTAPSRTRAARAALQWAAAGAAASALVGGGVAALVESAALHRVVPGPVRSEWGWWAATGLQLAVLVAGVLTGEPGGRRFLLTAIAAGAACLASGSMLVAARSGAGGWAQARGRSPCTRSGSSATLPRRSSHRCCSVCSTGSGRS